jgi:hypothetical protein
MKNRIFSVAVAAVTAIGSAVAPLAPVLGRVVLPSIAIAAVPLSTACSKCKKSVNAPLTRELLDRSLEIGTQFLLNNQKPEGNFNYEYDWKKKKLSEDDNQVRQVGAVWGLALIYHAMREDGRSAEDAAAVATAFEKSLEYFDSKAESTAAGERFFRYPGEKKGATGSIALLALGLVDFLRAGPPLTAERSAELHSKLDGYLAQLVRARRADGFFSGDYAIADGAPSGANNPYADGEAMLAMAKAAKYMGRDDLRPLALESAEKGWQAHVVEARKLDDDSATTKGFYQWSTMTFYELATSGWPETEQWNARILELADWMVDVHKTLTRTRNTGYAYEGIIHAWQIASSTGDEARTRKLGNVIDKGMAKLISWQVGSPIANECIGAPPNDPLAIGGVQNHAEDPPLRIDVTQHQMHAVILARRYFRK